MNAQAAAELDRIERKSTKGGPVQRHPLPKPAKEMTSEEYIQHLARGGL